MLGAGRGGVLKRSLFFERRVRFSVEALVAGFSFESAARVADSVPLVMVHLLRFLFLLSGLDH